MRTRTAEGTGSGKPSIGRLAPELGKTGHSVERHMRCRNCVIIPCPQAFPLLEENTTQATAVFWKGVAKRQYTSAFSPVSHALSACSAQKLAANVLEEELDATSPVLGGASFTQSPVGLETLSAVFGVVGASSTLSVGWSLSQSVPLLVHVCSQTSMILMGATLTSVRHAQCQTPSTQKRQRLLSRRRHSLRSRTMCTPPGKDATVKRRGAMSRRSSLRRADGPTGDPSCDSPADVASQGDQHRRTLCWLHAHKAPNETPSVFFCSPCGALHAGGTLRLLESQRDGS